MCMNMWQQQEIDTLHAVLLLYECTCYALYVQGLKQMQLYVGSRKGDPPASEISEYVSNHQA